MICNEMPMQFVYEQYVFAKITLSKTIGTFKHYR